MGVPTDVVRADQAMVSGCVGWTGQAIATGYREPGGHIEPTVPDGRGAGIDAARVAGSNVDTASQTLSVWAGVEPAKLYTGVGTSYLDAGIAGIPQPAYLGQPRYAPTQLASGQICHPLVFDPGAGTAPEPKWNHFVESWVRAHKDNQRMRHPTLQRQAGERASSLKPGKRGHRSDSPKRINLTSR